MAAEFKVDLDHLDQIVSKLAGLAGFVADHLDVIDDKVAGLVGTGWEGVAAEAYRVAHEEWVTGAREFAEGIRDMSAGANAAHGHYTAAVDVNVRMLRGGI
ncbi:MULTISPECIES: WXG100 family type VII secretion target [unclassified Nocardia]|uniref:WXG100 family type VII secretion target n=1 Tax=unclassified Nocardia TaxID=2637762 RepID=UPI0033A5F16B